MQSTLAIALGALLLLGNNPQQPEDLAIGGAIFQQPWIIAPASTTTRDGLGPLFKANSCIACHVQHGRGHPPLAETEPFMSTLVKLSIPATTAEQQAIAKISGSCS